MMRCKVNVPFKDNVTEELYEANAEITLSKERVAEVQAFDVNLISVIGEVKRSRKKKEQ